MIQVDFSAIGFRELKQLMVERGVPAAEVRFATDKRALQAVVSRCPGCRIEFIRVERREPTFDLDDHVRQLYPGLTMAEARQAFWVQHMR